MIFRKVPHRETIINLINTCFPRKTSRAALAVISNTFLYRWLYSNPYLDVFDKYQCVFIHIPKCAGISVENGLFGTKVGHKRIILFERYDAQKFHEYFKFTIVRNPFDRLVSAFFFLKSGGRNEKDRQWAIKNLAQYDEFNDFVFQWVKKENVIKALHFRPQYLYLCKPGSLVPEVEFVGRFEELEKDYNYIQEKLGLQESKLPHLNMSKRESDYRKFYDEETRAIVASVYQEDLSIFNYKF